MLPSLKHSLLTLLQLLSIKSSLSSGSLVQVHSLRSQLGAACYVNNDCGPNEVCSVASFSSQNCSMGLCTCKPCFGITNSSKICQPLTYFKLCLKPPCPPCFGTDNERYAENTMCRKLSPQHPTGIVKCIDYFFFRETIDYNCLPVYERPYKSKCRTNFECSKNLQCIRRCRCQPGLKWNGHRCVKPVYGDQCSSDHDCDVVGNMRCESVTGQCRCKSQWNAVDLAYFDWVTGSIVQKTVCVSGQTLNFGVKGAQCTKNDGLTADMSSAMNTFGCFDGSFCFSCPGDNFDNFGSDTNSGYCRELKGELFSYESKLSFLSSNHFFIDLFLIKDVSKFPIPIIQRSTRRNQFFLPWAHVSQLILIKKPTLKCRILFEFCKGCVDDAQCGYNEKCSK